MKDVRIGMIGLDTSHCIEFTKAFQGDVPAEQRIANLRVETCLRFPSAFQSEEGQNKRQAQLEQMGVKVTTSLEEAVKDKDAIMLEINDPALHEQYFRRVVELVPRLPMFLEKPLAGNFADGQSIVALARAKNVQVFECSGLRFMPPLEAACAQVPQPRLCHLYGWFNKAPAGSSYIWYGVHAMEVIERAMGRGAKSVRSLPDGNGVVSIIQYPDGRRAVAELCQGFWDIGGRLQSADKTVPFSHAGGSFNYHMLTKLRDFFTKAAPVPVAMDDMLEVHALLDAGDRALASGREEEVRR